MFHPDAVCIYSASGALLNTYHWEPVKLYQSLDLSNLFQSSEILISDLATSHKQLVGLLTLISIALLSAGMLNVHSHGQNHLRNFCRFKLDI